MPSQVTIDILKLNLKEINNKKEMEFKGHKYSREQFEGWKYRFKVSFETDRPFTRNLDIYSTSNSYSDLEEVIQKTKTNKVISFSIENRSSKIQDEYSSQFIDSFLNGL